MSLKTMMRVWEHSQTKRAMRCLMLALADFANDDGISWPGTANLAEKINESPDYTDILIKKCIEMGELAKEVGRGRGHKTRFAVLCGLAPDAQKRLKGVLQKGFCDTPFEKKEKRGSAKGVLTSDKRGTFPDSKQASFEALERAEPTHDEKLIRHDPVGSIESPPPTVSHDMPASGGDGGETFDFLTDQGIATAAEFAHVSYAVIKADYDARRADGQTKGLIVKAWKRKLPTADTIFGQTRAVNAPLVPTRPNRPETPISPAELLQKRGRNAAS